MWSLTWQKQKIVVVQKLAVPTDVAAMVAPTTVRLNAATMDVAEAKNS